TGRLWSRNEEIRLTPKASGVFGALVARAGDPVSKEDLLAAVWSGTAVSDDALTSCIQELRRALQDDAKRPRFIETRHRRGYRFVPRLSRPGGELRPNADAASIAVLPFVDLSPGQDQGYLCDGLAEEVISALARVDGWRVAARTSSSRFRAGADVRAV